MKTVWILEYRVDYEGSGIIDVYESQRQAECRKTSIERECEEYKKEMDRTDYKSDMKMPDYLNDFLSVQKYNVIEDRICLESENAELKDRIKRLRNEIEVVAKRAKGVK